MNADTDPLDLTMSHLRAVSNNHVHYLKTILGLRASMSMAIIVNDSLWGLYCLHSSTKPTKPSVEQRIMLEMVGSICSMRIDFFEREMAAKRRVDVAMVMRNIDTKENLPEFLNAYYKDILGHLNAQAIVVYDGDTRMTFGDEFIVPTAEGYQALQRRCKENTALSLSNFGPGLEGLGSGVIFYRHTHASIAIVRRAQVSDITWGQNPTKKFGSDNQMYQGKVPYGKQFHPGLEKPSKEPFTVMVERNRAEVINWSELDLDLATNFFDRTTQFLHEKMLETFRVRIDESNSTAVKAIETAQERYEFFAHMSHELRTPFHGIISSLQILKSGKIEEEERKEIVDSALECGKSMTTTLNDILTIAKERTGTEAAHQPVLVHRVIKTTKRMMGPIAETKGVAFGVEQGIYVHSEDKSALSNWPVWEYLVLMTDTTRVGQVTNNLTGNAIKFTPPGGKVTINGYVASRGDMVQLWRKASSQYAAAHTPMFPDDPKLETLPLHTDDPWYIFYVEDTGCGVTGEDIIVMFEAYKQVKAAKNTGAYQGTGLGLHICTTHAQQLGGLLAAASTQGKGTLFFFAVPVSLMADKQSDEDKKAAAAAQTEKDNAVLKPEEVDYINGKNASFLIVDDSKINIRLTKRKIQLQLSDKVPVDYAYDGLEGIEYYKKALEAKTTDKITGIFMDYHMPNCSGVECILELRRLEKLYNVPPVYIIAFTADLSETSHRSLLNAGADEIMGKPTCEGVVESTSLRVLRLKNINRRNFHG
jgi:light-regulated signal transduction histidine kinase (bacteriophytochrome)/CheY-like chemotaxis protein